MTDWTYIIDESCIVAFGHYMAEIRGVYGAYSRYGGARGAICYILQFLSGTILRVLLLGRFPLYFNVHATSSCKFYLLFFFSFSLPSYRFIYLFVCLFCC